MNSEYEFVRSTSLSFFLFALFLSQLFIGNLYGQLRVSDAPERSGGSYRSSAHSTAGVDIGPYSLKSKLPLFKIAAITGAFEGFDFDDNAAENGGFVFIPPDLIGADCVIAVVNKMTETREKTAA